MFSPTSPLDAYRQDLATATPNLTGPVDRPAAHGVWIAAAELLARLGPDGPAVQATIRDAVRRALHTLLVETRASRDEAPHGDPDRPVDNPGRSDDADLAARLVALADVMEAEGTPRLAWATLLLVPRALPQLPPDTLGLALSQRARIARKLGELEIAGELYDDAARVGRAAGTHALVVRATIGRGVVARVRGNYPEARVCFEGAAREAGRHELPELESHAHHGLLLAAAAAGDYDRALRHGWAALDLAAGSPTREADLLVNLAAVCGDAGAHAAAVHGYLAAANRIDEVRVRVPALAGAAVSAAALGDVELVRALTEALRPALAAVELPYETAQAGVLLARAWTEMTRQGGARSVEVRWAHEFAERARAIANRHGFHEVVHGLDRLEAAGRLQTSAPAAAPDAPRARVVAPSPDAARELEGPMARRGGTGWGRGRARASAGHATIRTRPARAVVAALAALPVGDRFAPATAALTTTATAHGAQRRAAGPLDGTAR